MIRRAYERDYSSQPQLSRGHEQARTPALASIYATVTTMLDVDYCYKKAVRTSRGGELHTIPGCKPLAAPVTLRHPPRDPCALASQANHTFHTPPKVRLAPPLEAPGDIFTVPPSPQRPTILTPSGSVRPHPQSPPA